jgi:hypothetical protein
MSCTKYASVRNTYLEQAYIPKLIATYKVRENHQSFNYLLFQYLYKVWQQGAKVLLSDVFCDKRPLTTVLSFALGSSNRYL